MRSLRLQIMTLMLASLVLLSAGIIVVLGKHMEERTITAAIIKADSDLATCTEIIDLRYPGEWRVEDGRLYKGDTLISNANHIVDHLASLTGDTVTIFLNDTRVATTVRNANGQRAIGTKVSDEVAEKVLKNGERYLGEANVVGQTYQTAYEPIRDGTGKIIGMLYVGISRDYTEKLIVNSLRHMALLGLGLTAVIGLITWYFFERVVFRPLRRITVGTRDLATGHTTVPVNISGPKEIGELAAAFNQVVQRLEVLAKELEERLPHENHDHSQKNYHQNHEHSDQNHDQNCGHNRDHNQDHNQDYNRDQTNALQRLVPTSRSDTLHLTDSYAGASNGKFDVGAATEQGAPKNHFLDCQEILEEWQLPKGLHKETLIQIVDSVRRRSDSFSAEDVAEKVGLTRVTVRRYLEYLEEAGKLTSELKYGTIGRPVRVWSHINIKKDV